MRYERSAVSQNGSHGLALIARATKRANNSRPNVRTPLLSRGPASQYQYDCGL
jgi:hypothetical protein